MAGYSYHLDIQPFSFASDLTTQAGFHETECNSVSYQFCCLSRGMFKLANIATILLRSRQGFATL